VSAARRWFEKRTDRVVVNSEAVRKHCLAAGIEERKIAFIADGADAVEKSTARRQELLRELKLQPDAKLVTYVGGLTKQKRLKELIWAIDQLKAVNSSAYLLIVGDGPLRNSLERYTWLNRVEDRVRFLGFRSDVDRLLAQADVLWQAGAGEGQSNAILEAMGAGVPVVAADASGNREVVVPGETGYLVPLQERAGFARCTLPLLEDAELAARLGAAGQRQAMELHRMNDMVAGYAKIYQELCGG
jgi:glycosyltransferase involved in cell wall biosynthesis